MAACDNIRINDFSQILVHWEPVGPFDGLAKDSSAVTTNFREDGGELEMSSDGYYGTIEVDNDYSAEVKVKFDSSSPTYGYLMKAYQAKKGALGTLTISRSSGETDTVECAFIKDMGESQDGYRATNHREVTFHGARRNYDAGRRS